MKRLARVRQANAIISAVMLVLFLVHGVGNSFALMGMAMPLGKGLAHVILTLAVVHAVLGVILTVATFSAQREAGVSYVGLNSRFWAVRISGLAIAPLVALHMLTFMLKGDGPYGMRAYAELEVAANVCLVLAVAIHVIANTRPMLVSLGIGAPKAFTDNIMLVLSVLLLLMGVAFVVFYLTWNVM